MVISKHRPINRASPQPALCVPACQAQPGGTDAPIPNASTLLRKSGSRSSPPDADCTQKITPTSFGELTGTGSNNRPKRRRRANHRTSREARSIQGGMDRRAPTSSQVHSPAGPLGHLPIETPNTVSPDATKSQEQDPRNSAHLITTIKLDLRTTSSPY